MEAIVVALSIAVVALLIKIERDVSSLSTWRELQDKKCDERHGVSRPPKISQISGKEAEQEL